MPRIRWLKVALFIAIAFLLDWGLAAWYYAAGGRLSSPFFVLMALGYMFGPAVAALLVQGVFFREPLARPLGISLRPSWWFIAAWFFPVVLALLTVGISLLLPGVHFDPGMNAFFAKLATQLPPEQYVKAHDALTHLPLHLFWISLLGGLAAGTTINAIAALGEELGWRGFLYNELKPLGFWRMSLLIGIIWGIWHAPLIIQGYNYPQHPRLGLLMMTLMTTLLAPIMSYARYRTGSVFAPAILHGTFNGVVGAAILIIAGGSDLTVGVTGAAGLLALLVVNLTLLLYHRKPVLDTDETSSSQVPLPEEQDQKDDAG